MSRILKSIAIATGTGLAIGLGALVGSRTRSVRLVQSAAEGDEILNLEPLFDRLERIETHLEVSLRNPASLLMIPPEDAVMTVELERRIEVQAAEIQSLRAGLQETERKLATESGLTESRFAQVQASIPESVNAAIATGAADLRAGLESNLAEGYRERLMRFEASIEEKVVARMASLEHTLRGQAASIGSLREHAAETDSSLQRLIEAVEKLCERGAPVAAAPIPALDPFQTQLQEAMRRQGNEDTPQARVIKAAEQQETRRPRIPMAPLMALVASVAGLFRLR